MIEVNGTKIQWLEGMTVRDVLKQMNYVWVHIIVSVNGQAIEQQDYNNYQIPDNAKVEVLNIFHGG